MHIRSLSRGEAEQAMTNWLDIYPSLPDLGALDEEYQQIREDLQELNRSVREKLDATPEDKRKDYNMDAQYGLAIYEYFMEKEGFNLRAAANDGFWRFLSVRVIPDVVAQRWGKDNHDHFWRMPSRNWLRSLWWFVHLSWQGSLEETRKVLECRHFNTDTILNFEERTGRKGTCVEAYREIIKLYSLMTDDEIQKYNSRKKSNSDNLFRVVMKLNTAKMMVMEPALYAGGEKEYAKSLFRDAGVNF